MIAPVRTSAKYMLRPGGNWRDSALGTLFAFLFGWCQIDKKRVLFAVLLEKLRMQVSIGEMWYSINHTSTFITAFEYQVTVNKSRHFMIWKTRSSYKKQIEKMHKQTLVTMQWCKCDSWFYAQTHIWSTLCKIRKGKTLVCSQILGLSRSACILGYTLGIWICGCILIYRRELWASKSTGDPETLFCRTYHVIY